jgi:3-dehydroquinate synthase
MMTKKIIKFSNSSTSFYFDANFAQLEKIVAKENAIMITDENVFTKNKNVFKGWRVIVLQAGEQYKNQAAVDNIIEQLITAGANRKTFLIGVGGGVVTDVAGYVAGIYMRGISFGFVPTSILAMVDASIGGKNGVDIGLYKNMIGLIRQPSFLLYDYSLLKLLPKEEWINGFAEIIKHSCIKDAAMFALLEEHKLADFQKNKILLNKIIQRNALLKSKVVQQDEFETGERKILNFGHTLGHAIENEYQLPHGHAVAIGMVTAAYLSRDILGFKMPEKIIALIEKYGLPPFSKFNAAKALRMMYADKKRAQDVIHYVLLEKIGKAVVKSLTIKQIQPVVEELSK